MTSQQLVTTPFANQRGSSQLSADAPEFVVGSARPRTSPSLKAKDSASSMAETDSEEAKPQANGNAQPASPETPETRETSSAVEASNGAAVDRQRDSKSQGGLPQPVSPAPLSRHQSSSSPGAVAKSEQFGTRNASGRPGRPAQPPLAAAPTQQGSNRRPGGPRPLAHSAYPEPYGMNGQPMMMYGGASQGHFYAPAPYGQMYAVQPPVPLGVQQRDGHLLYHPQPPYMVPQPQWPYHMLRVPGTEHYGARGFAPPYGMPVPPGGYYPGAFDERFGQAAVPELQWRPHAGQPAQHTAFAHNGATAGGGGSAAWSRDGHSGRSRPPSAGVASRTVSGSMSDQTRAADGDSQGHVRQLSTSSSERRKGHRRMVSVPTDFSAATTELAEPSGQEIAEELREGGRRGSRHSRSDSWLGSSRSSPLLEEFKSGKDAERKWTLADVKGHVVEFCKDQAGSRFIQQALEDPETTLEQVREVALEARPRFPALMEDVFGNYVIQKLLERTEPAERAWMADCICREGGKASGQSRAVALSRQQYGCRVVQKALETLDVKSKIQLMEQLLESALDLVADQNGNHVVQKCIECIKPTAHIEPLIDELLSGRVSRTIPVLRGAVVSLSQHTYGCRVVQRVLEHCDEPRLKQRFMAEILEDVLDLSSNIYSNYVIQHVLEYGELHERDRVLSVLSPHVIALSLDKYASNVVERCLKHGRPAQRRWIIQEFLNNEPAFVQMMKDDYGNYVCYRAFEFADDDQKRLLVEVIKGNVPAVRRTSFGKNFHSKLAEKHPDFFSGPDLGFPGVYKGPTLRQPRQAPYMRSPASRQPAPVSAATPPQAREEAAAPPVQREPRTAVPPAALPGPVRLYGHPPAPADPKAAEDAAAAGPQKSDDGPAKFPSGQVSVMADGANPPVHAPVPAAGVPVARTGSGAGSETAGCPLLQQSSQDAAAVARSPKAVFIEG